MADKCDWYLSRILGEGAFGEVRLMINKKSKDAVAAKMIDMKANKSSTQMIMREIQIHRSLKHENIISCFGHRREGDLEFIFLEYASGGELFDRIEPDIGMAHTEALKYFSQIISGVEYLHSKGIAHRDLKPENLLLNDKDVVKISDFGTATLFRVKGESYLSTTRCGTVAYMAPEVFAEKPYQPEFADIWSCGVILVALLCGELPWDQPTMDCKEFRNWTEHKIFENPWTKIDNLALSLISKILISNVKHRYTIDDIRGHRWYRKYSGKLLRNNGSAHLTSPVAAKRRRTTSSSQPVQPNYDPDEHNLTDSSTTSLSQPLKSFSQPSHIEDLVVNTQAASQFPPTEYNGDYYNICQKLVKRMTRFFTNLSVEDAGTYLADTLEKMNYSINKNTSNVFTVSTTDKRKLPLAFKASIIEMKSNQVLIDFRLSRGDGLEFKRHFIDIRNCLGKIILQNPISWELEEIF